MAGALLAQAIGSAPLFLEGPAASTLPVYALDATCADPRFPALAGPWAVGCGPLGMVDRAVFLPTNTLILFPEPMSSPCVSAGQVWEPGVAGRLLRLGPRTATAEPAAPSPSPAGPCATADGLLASQRADQLSLGEKSGPRRHLPARPIGWSPLAIAAGWLAWVEAVAPGVPQVFVWDGQGAGRPLGAPGSRHVVGAGGRLAWIEPGHIARWDPVRDEVERWPADTGFSAGLGFDGEIVCWETRGARDVDLQCSDGLQIRGPGHQRAPSQWGPYLLHRAEGHTWLTTRGATRAATRAAGGS